MFFYGQDVKVGIGLGIRVNKKSRESLNSVFSNLENKTLMDKNKTWINTTVKTEKYIGLK